MPVDLLFRKVDAKVTLPLFRPRCAEPRRTSLRFGNHVTGTIVLELPNRS
jgi:hypothetical protein